LKVSATTVSKTTSGKLVNLMTVDAGTIADAFTILRNAWMALFQIICKILKFFTIPVCVGLLFYIIGYVTFVGLGVIILLFPFLFLLLLAFTSLIPVSLTQRDKRISLMNEILQNIKNIKFFGWESEYEKKVNKVRYYEAILYQLIGSILGIVFSIMIATPTLITVTTLIVFSVVDGQHFKPEVIYPAISYFILLKFPLFSLPYSLADFLQVRVSSNRILEFLNDEEVDPLVN
jgi:ATP-binding cassette, subfamily C (CFTR/MRP), member 1